jgi:membrane protease YdiL (CAAX protease family)
VESAQDDGRNGPAASPPDGPTGPPDAAARDGRTSGADRPDPRSGPVVDGVPAPRSAAPPETPGGNDPDRVTNGVAAAVPHRDPATPGAVPPAGWPQGPPAYGPAGYAEPRPYGAVPPAGWPEGPTAYGPTTYGVPGNGAALNPADPYAFAAQQPAPTAASGPPPSPSRHPGFALTGHSAPRTHRWGLGAYLLVELVFLAASAAIGVFVIGREAPQAGTLAIALAVPTMIAAGLALLITRVRGNGPRTDLRLHWSWRDARLGVAFGVGGLFVTLPASMIYVAIVGQDATSAVGEVFGDIRASLPLAIVIFVAVVVIAPLCEEIVYRGLLWGAVERLGANRWVAMVVTTLLFALAHFEFTRTPLLLVVAIPIALARLYTDGLLASIVAHQVNNLLPGIALLLGLTGVIPMV